MADLQMKTIRYPGINNLYRFMQPDGTYPDLTAGNIISNDAYNEDTEPYLFRALPYKSKRLEEDLVGATVNWNQLAEIVGYQSPLNGVTFTVNNDGSVTVNGTASGNARWSGFKAPAIAGHVYYSQGCPSGGSDSTYRLYSSYIGVSLDRGSGRVVKHLGPTSFPDANAEIFISDGYTANNLVFKPQFFDLTAMFGSTIADYVYSLEQATAGSGIAWLKSYGFFTKPYYEYDAGTLKSVNPTAHVTRGVNAWDEEWEVGTYKYTTDGSKGGGTSNIRNKNYIPISPNTEYYIRCDYSSQISGFYVLLFYDANKNYISYTGSVQTRGVFTTPANAHYMNFYASTYYGTTYNNDICINISDPTINGKYFPYEEHTYDLGNVPLYGLFQLVDNTLKAYGDVRHAEGGTDRKFGLMDLGTLTWDLSSSGYFTATVSDAKLPVDVYHAPLMICKYPSVQAYDLVYNTDGKFDKTSSISSSTGKLLIRDSTYSDAATFKTAMSGLYLVYEKTTPTTEDTPSFEKIQSCFLYGTEEYITTNGVPVGHDTKYYTDVISNIAGIPEPPSGNGTYELKLTVTDGMASYSWVAV